MGGTKGRALSTTRQKLVKGALPDSLDDPNANWVDTTFVPRHYAVRTDLSKAVRLKLEQNGWKE